MKVSESRKTDRIIVIAAAIVGMALAVWAILLANGFGGQFKPPQAASASRGKELLAQALAKVDDTKAAQGLVANTSPVVWHPVKADAVTRGFLVSTGLVFRRGSDTASDSVVDLNKENPQLRPPFPNSYFRKYALQLEFSNVGELDPDGDFFSNLEEFQFSQKLGKEFSPVDPQSHPDLHFKLRFVQFAELPYLLKFTSPSPPSFGLRYEAEDRKQRWSQSAELAEDANGNGVLDPGEDLNFSGQLDPAKPAGRNADEGRFIVIGYKTVQEKEGDLVVPRVIATFEDTFRAKGHPLRTFELKEGTSINLKVREGIFEYLPKPGKPIQKKEFEKFTLPDTLSPSYLLVALDTERAVLRYEGEGKQKEIILPKGQPPEVPQNVSPAP